MSKIEATMKHIQGSVWHWDNRNLKKDGVQSSERPVLIISNDNFNKHSSAVNRLSITTVLKDSPVHEPIYIATDSHIQCELIRTIPKAVLIGYIGAIPATTLLNVKAKLKIQFDIVEDENFSYESFMSLEKRIEYLIDEIGLSNQIVNSNHVDMVFAISKLETAFNKMDKGAYSEDLRIVKTLLQSLHSKAEEGFGLPEIENTVLQLLSNLHTSIVKATSKTTTKNNDQSLMLVKDKDSA